MAQKIKKGFFKILPWSVAVWMIFTVSVGLFNSMPKVQPALAADTISSSVYIDANNDGQIDHIKITFDTNITQCIYASGDWSVNTAGDFNISITGINTADPESTGEGDCDGSDAVVYISVSADSYETGSTVNPDIAYTNNANNLQDSGNISSKASIVATDKAAPVPVSASYTDATGDGTVDRVDIILSTDWAVGCSWNALDWSFPNAGTVGISSSVWCTTSAPTTVMLGISGTYAGRTGGAVNPTIVYTNNANRVDDGFGNSMITWSAPLTVTDAAAPVVVDQTYFQLGIDSATVDGMDLNWSELVSYNGLDLNQFSINNQSLTNFDSDGTPDSLVSGGSGSGDYLMFSTSGTTNLTGVSGGTEPAVTYTESVTTANRVKDLIGNDAASPQGPLTLKDCATPVILSAVYLDTDSNGSIETIRTTWSENVIMSGSTAVDWTIVGGDINAVFSSAPDDLVPGTTLDVLVTADVNETGSATAVTIAYDDDDMNQSVVDSTGVYTNQASTTGPKVAADAAAPVLVSTTPANGAVGVAISQPLVWTFSESMVTTFGTPAQFASTNDPGGWVATWSGGNKTVSMAHTAYVYGVIVNITTNEANINAASGSPTLLDVTGSPPAPDDFSFATQTAGGGGGGGGGGTLLTTITLGSPNGGESWVGNSSHNITWSSTGGTISKIKLFYSIDRGVNFPYLIAEDEANDGTYSWIVPNISSGTVKIKINGYDSAGGLLTSDISDADFIISYTAPTVSVSKSTIEASPSSVTADGVSESTITVTVKDEAGAALSGKTVAISSSRGATDTVTTVKGTTGSDGIATFKVKSGTVGTSTYTANAAGVVIDGTAAVVFTGAGEPSVPSSEIPAGLKVGDLIKSSLSTTVYYYGSDNKRHIFPNALTYRTWYLDWSGIKIVSNEQLRGIPLGENVTVRAGTVLVKIQTDPKVYAVEPDGLLRWVPTEERARTLYGDTWASRIIDVPLVFWGDYAFGADITTDTYPTGALIKYAGTAEVYYVQGAEKRLIATEAAFTANNFRWINVLTAPATIYYTTGADITGKELPLAAIY